VNFVKKVILITPYYLPTKGGITTFVKNLYKDLNSNYNVDVRIISKDGTNDDNVYVVRGNKYSFILKTYRILKKENPDIVHSHGHWYTLSPAVKYKRLNPRTRVVFTFHTEPVERMRVYKTKIFERMISKCDTITFVSNDLMNKIEVDMQIEKEKRVVYAGVNVETVNDLKIEEFKKNHKLENCTPVLSWIGPLEYRQKIEGLKFLVRAIDILSKKYQNIKLLVVGKGKYGDELEELVNELGLRDRIIFLGHVENSLVSLAASDMYAHISLQEGGVSFAILEAMSIGKPVIASRTGGIPELIKDRFNGILTDSDPSSLSSAIDELYSDKQELKRIGMNAKTTIEKEFTAAKMTERFMDLYLQATQ
jgi:glycosyltransferase involved in cell wall biosynthesis